MQRKLDQWTMALAVVAIVGTLLACKKRTTEATPAAETAAATPTTPPAVTTPAVAPTVEAAAADPSRPVLGEAKRYPDKEKAQTGAVRILADDVKVFNEADDKTANVATLSKGLLVFRLASVPDYELVEFPSGVGKVSPGWVLAKFVDGTADAKVARDAVAAQSAQAVVTTPPKPASTGTAKTVALSPSAKAAADKAAADKAAATKAATDKAAADKAAADKAAADKAAADKAAADKALRAAERAAKRAADKAKKAADAAAAGK